MELCRWNGRKAVGHDEGTLMKKRIVAVLTISALCMLLAGLALVGCSSGAADGEASTAETAVETIQASSTQPEPTQPGAYVADSQEFAEVHHAVLTVDGYDPITIELNTDAAPVTVANFITLSESGFYDGVTFHRIVPGFCLQGGDPTGTGTGGSGTAILGEFSTNGVPNPLADNYQRGTVAMARAQDPDSASSQFFITLSDSAAPSLNGQYAAFGTISEADMETVDRIVADYEGVATGPNGTIADVSAQPTIVSIEIVD